ncbi:hypothetical protein FJY63_01330, partial [Candidatus Sumerlaeota bacterium]|nr:hypothetical protein [Candidatus Sumerlaeota bacterium]
SGRVVRFAEKPQSPPTDRISVGIYVFNKDALLRQLERLDRGEQCFNLARDIIPGMVASHRVVRYCFEGHWNYLETVEDYYRANLSLLGDSPDIDLAGWGVMTNLNDRELARRPSAYLGPSAEASDSLISPGCHIEGKVERSVLSPGVVVERDAVVRDSILMHDVRVERGANLHQVVCDKDVVFEAGTVIGSVQSGREQSARKRGQRGGEGPLELTLIGKGLVVGPNSGSYWRAGRALARSGQAAAGTPGKRCAVRRS